MSIVQFIASEIGKLLDLHEIEICFQLNDRSWWNKARIHAHYRYSSCRLLPFYVICILNSNWIVAPPHSIWISQLYFMNLWNFVGGWMDGWRGFGVGCQRLIESLRFIANHWWHTKTICVPENVSTEMSRPFRKMVAWKSMGRVG